LFWLVCRFCPALLLRPQGSARRTATDAWPLVSAMLDSVEPAVAAVVVVVVADDGNERPGAAQPLGRVFAIVIIGRKRRSACSGNGMNP
jgi:hypothetical protein